MCNVCHITRNKLARQTVHARQTGQHQHQHVVNGRDGQHVGAGQDEGQIHGVVLNRGVVMSTRGGRGAEPARCRRARGVEIVQAAVKPTAQPEKDIKKKESKIKKEMEYSLGCWSL